jgi:membrane-associated phospholipid phosphatase
VPLLVLVIAATLAGTLVALAARRYPHAETPTGPPRHGLAARLDPQAATGLALTLALVLLIGGGTTIAVLALVLRGDPDAIGIDNWAARWGADHATPFTTDVLSTFTDIGRPLSIALMAIVLAVEETIRTRNRWIAPFLLLVVAGNGILTTTIKNAADRVRPELNPIAETLGPSFPSGHSSWSAAFFAAAALVLSRGRSRRTRIALAGAAAGLAVATATSRVLLSVHWVSDVVAGLALGWAWFAACAIAFGGRFLSFGAGARRELAPDG